MRNFPLYALLLLLTGCVLGPNYHRPAIDAPATYLYESDKATGTLDLAWWEQFDDPVLTDLIKTALQNNNNIKAAAANIKEALGIMIQVRAPLFPQIGYSGEYDRTRFSDSSLSLPSALPTDINIPNPSTTWQALGTASWEIDLWGRTRRLTESAMANILAACQARQAVILSLVTSVANNYLFLRGLDEQLAISIRTMEAYEEELIYFEKQFKYGQTSEMSVAQAKSQYENAASQIPQIRTQIVQTENAIAVLLSSNPRHIPRGKSIYDLKLPTVPAGIPSQLLCQRPDIIQAEQNLIAANAQIGAAQALYFPSISLTGYYGGSSSELKNLFTGPAKTWNFTGSITGPIFTGGSIYGQVLQAKASEKAALYTYEQTIQNAFADVENALITHTMLVDQLGSETAFVEAAGQYQHLATLQWQGGYSPYFVVIQAQEQYFPAQLTWARTRTQLFTSLVNIYQSMGGDWLAIADRLTTPCN